MPRADRRRRSARNVRSSLSTVHSCRDAAYASVDLPAPVPPTATTTCSPWLIDAACSVCRPCSASASAKHVLDAAAERRRQIDGRVECRIGRSGDASRRPTDARCRRLDVSRRRPKRSDTRRRRRRATHRCRCTRDREGGRGARAVAERIAGGAVATRPTRRNPRTARRSLPTATRRRPRAPRPDRPDGRLDACGFDHTARRSDMSEGTTSPDTITRLLRRRAEAGTLWIDTIGNSMGRAVPAGARVRVVAASTATPRRGVGDVRRRRTRHRAPGARCRSAIDGGCRATPTDHPIGRSGSTA